MEGDNRRRIGSKGSQQKSEGVEVIMVTLFCMRLVVESCTDKKDGDT
jgi:hypothetical protein